MQRYRRINHDITFDDWWACQNCLAKGPALNKRNCINPTHNHVGAEDDDDRHRHKRRKTEAELERDKIDDRSNGADLGIMIEVQKEKSDDRSNGADTGSLVNKQARKRAEEKQAEVNENKRRKHIEAHQKNNEFNLPRNEAIKHIENTEEQTNHSLFNGKEVRKKTMLKAKQIQSHKRIKTNKARQKHAVKEDEPEDRLDEEPIDKSDTEYIYCVERINVYQNNIDQNADRDRQVAKSDEEREEQS
eukprot:10193795-Heterocapsa_arctica.AAC.1